MNAELNWWLLIVGVVAGAGLLWLVLGDWSRREEEVGAAERAREAEWIADVLRAEGAPLDPSTTEVVLRLHRTWLRETGAYDPLDDELAVAETGPDTEPATEPAAVTPVAATAPDALPRIREADDDLRVHAARPIRSEPLPED